MQEQVEAADDDGAGLGGGLGEGGGPGGVHHVEHRGRTGAGIPGPFGVIVGRTVEHNRSPSRTSDSNGRRSTSMASRPAAASRSPALARSRTRTTADARPVARRAARAAQAVAPAPRMVAPGGAVTPASASAATMPGTSVL